MEGPIARWYATSTGKATDRFEESADAVRRRTPQGSDILEVAPGPGYLSIMLARTGDYTVTGLDVSETFVEIARGKAAEAGAAVDFRLGNASSMPFDDESFDFVVCCAAFKNFSDPVGALREMHRVLRPGGGALILDLRRDVSKEAVDADVARMGLGALSRAFTKFTLRFFLPRRAYVKSEFEDLIARTAFSSHEVRLSPLSLEVDLRK
ncbi:class I SAM-dependent methyltransferase [Nonomuraea sp. K274]|uniref:Class I SAM-dependent methyltransferase n=2 Tax=Nonomuraea cypriaca TaxID=1187855 RepID=A0A931ANQ9_9ACTN|nr:class I SAM-dependent methyltransferase [Nonomuraea cypriaca]